MPPRRLVRGRRPRPPRRLPQHRPAGDRPVAGDLRVSGGRSPRVQCPADGGADHPLTLRVRPGREGDVLDLTAVRSMVRSFPWGGLLSTTRLQVFGRAPWSTAHNESDASSNLRRQRDLATLHDSPARALVAGIFVGRSVVRASGGQVISFVWSPGERLPAGTGGSENYTVGQVRELNRRGIDARVVTIGLGRADGRDEFSDIPFHSVRHLEDVGDLDDTVVFVSEAPHVATRRQAYQILHVPPPLRARQRAEVADATRDRILIATSRFAADMWAVVPRCGRRDRARGPPVRRAGVRRRAAARTDGRATSGALRGAAEPGEGDLHVPLDVAHRPDR